MAHHIKTINFFYHEDNAKAAVWAARLKKYLAKRYPKIANGIRGDKKKMMLIVLGGDGTILEAARKYQNAGVIIAGFNLGHVGFLASVREQKKFISAFDKLIRGKYIITERMLLSAKVWRKQKTVFKTHAVNDIVIQNPIGIVEIEAAIETYPVQYIKGTGVLVSTGTGSTAYNLSAHGPIVMPNIKCMILTEILDHNIPTPSMVIQQDHEIKLTITNFKKQGILSLSTNKKPVDILLIADGETIFPLEKADSISIKQSSRLVTFAELEKNYFFKSLHEKFAFT